MFPTQKVQKAPGQALWRGSEVGFGQSVHMEPQSAHTAHNQGQRGKAFHFELKGRSGTSRAAVA